jgi:hypothetical protein
MKSQKGFSILLVMGLMIMATIVVTSIVAISKQSDFASIDEKEMQMTETSVQAGRDAALSFITQKGYELAASLQVYHDQVLEGGLVEPVKLPLPNMQDNNGLEFSVYVTGVDFSVDRGQPVPVKIQVVSRLVQNDNVKSLNAKEYVLNVYGLYLDESRIENFTLSNIPTEALYIGGRTIGISQDMEIVGDFYSAYMFKNDATVRIRGDMLFGGTSGRADDKADIHGSLIVEGNFYSHLPVNIASTGDLLVNGNAEFGHSTLGIAFGRTITVEKDVTLNGYNPNKNWQGDMTVKNNLRITKEFDGKSVFTGKLDVEGRASVEDKLTWTGLGKITLGNESKFHKKFSGPYTSLVENAAMAFVKYNTTAHFNDSTKLFKGNPNAWPIDNYALFDVENIDYLRDQLDPNSDYQKVETAPSLNPDFINAHGKTFDEWNGERDGNNRISASGLNTIYNNAPNAEKPNGFLVVRLQNAAEDLFSSNPIGDLLEGRFIFVAEVGGEYGVGGSVDTEFPAMSENARVMFWIRNETHMEKFSVTPRNDVGICRCFIFTESEADRFVMRTTSAGDQQHVLGSVHIGKDNPDAQVNFQGANNTLYKFEYDPNVLGDIFATPGLSNDENGNPIDPTQELVDTRISVHSSTLKVDVLGAYQIPVAEQIHEEEVDGDGDSGYDTVKETKPYLALSKYVIKIDKGEFENLDELLENISFDGLVSYGGRFATFNAGMVGCVTFTDDSEATNEKFQENTQFLVNYSVNCDGQVASRALVVYVGNQNNNDNSSNDISSSDGEISSDDAPSSSSIVDRNCTNPAWHNSQNYGTTQIVSYNNEDWEANYDNYNSKPPGTFQTTGCTDPAFDDNFNYTTGFKVSFENRIYECGQVSNWCGNFVPTNTYINAWTDLGPCASAASDVNWIRLGLCEIEKDPATIESSMPMVDGNLIKFAGDSVKFTWSKSVYEYLEGYRLKLGSTPGADDLASVNVNSDDARVAIVTGLPVDGSVIYATLWTYYSDGDLSHSLQFEAHGIAAPATYTLGLNIDYNQQNSDWGSQCNLTRNLEDGSYNAGTAVNASVTCDGVPVHHTIVKWKDYSTGDTLHTGSVYNFAMNSDKDIDVFINRKEYILSFEAKPAKGGTFDVDDQVFVKAGDSVSVDVNKKADYIFSKWNDDYSSSSRTFSDVLGNAHYIAIFTEDQESGVGCVAYRKGLWSSGQNPQYVECDGKACICINSGYCDHNGPTDPSFGYHVPNFVWELASGPLNCN